MGIAFVDLRGLDWDEERPTVVQTPTYAFFETEEDLELEIEEAADPDADSIEVDLLFLELSSADRRR